MTELPLVSCIMPTANRRAFVPGALRCFLAQDYPHLELVVVDDGSDPVSDLLPAGEARIRYVRLGERLTVGAKRNVACREARGEIILHWDDDDWYAPHRVRYQVEALLRERADVNGLNSLFFYDRLSGEAYKYSYPGDRRPWVSGSTMCYHRRLWQENPFPALDVGEDAAFLWSGVARRIVGLEDLSIHVAMIHPGNVSPKRVRGAYWQPWPAAEVVALFAPAMGNSDPAVAQQAHLGLPEFVAVGHGQPLVRMRQWEVPFALFQARLGENMAVLDCSINPGGFKERLLALYPNTLYKHLSPLQEGAYRPLVEAPEGAWDRVVCINTLEHLLREQRADWLGAMARCLKPGGLLVLTLDHYFESLWERPELLRRGYLRADRAEVFGGFNRVTLSELRGLAQQAGLEVGLLPDVEPSESDPRLYRNSEPYPHGAIGAVFQKPGPAVRPGPAIVLGLLTWNTREISLESVRAYLEEARMLQRLGCTPYLCVVDNGSTDGTGPALRELAEGQDLPHRFICNDRNRGNAVARNQMIDYLLETEAEYLLLMDGDIEVVPFSSYAMLRYMEGRSSRLGCVGACSAGQTPERAGASRTLFSLEPLRKESGQVVAWTQYGLFRREVFAAGVRFDENPPFGEPGWGFEDNDLAFQMVQKGFEIQRFFGMTYLHRAMRSSTRNLREEGADPAALFEQRREYLVKKWSEVPGIDPGPLGVVRRVRVQL